MKFLSILTLLILMKMQETFINRIKSLSTYIHIQPNFWYKKLVDPTSEPLYQNDQEESLNTMNLPEAWGISSGQGVVVAVLDTGLRIDHEEFCPNAVVDNVTNTLDLNGCTKVVAPRDFITSLPSGCNAVPGVDYTVADGLPFDDDGHGTHVSGIVAASKNSKGIIGTAYDSKVMPIRVLAKCILK